MLIKIVMFVSLGLFSGCKSPLVKPDVSPDQTIFESEHISRFIDEVDRQIARHNQIVVALDIDDTIFQPQGHLGTPSWFYGMVAVLQNNGVEKSVAHSVMGKIDTEVQPHLEVKFIEPVLFAAINRWQKNGIVVFAITSRPPYLQSATKRQFASLNLAFTHPTLSCVEKDWALKNALFHGGVVHVHHGLSKEHAFDYFRERLNNCGASFDTLAYTDDQERYVMQLSHSAKKSNASFVGQIYTKAIKERKFSMDDANKELYHLVHDKKLSIIPETYHSIFFSHLYSAP